MDLRFKLCFVLLVSFIFSSCEKEIDLALITGEDKIVVEGVIETDEYPYVTITKSIAFFSKIDLSNVGYIKDAIITVEDLNNNKLITLKEYSIDTLIDGTIFSFVVYAPDFADTNSINFKGQVNHSYKLSINSGGKNYESITKIPFPTPLDSLFLVPVPDSNDSLKICKGMYDDPDTLGNCVRIETLMQRKNKKSEPERFYTASTSVYDDDVINGIRFPVTIDLGYDKNRPFGPDENFLNINYLRKGDTLTIKWSAIDKQTFRFWETLAFSKGSIGNPFASPTKVQGNIPGAIGIWGGYSPTYQTIIDSL